MVAYRSDGAVAAAISHSQHQQIIVKMGDGDDGDGDAFGDRLSVVVKAPGEAQAARSSSSSANNNNGSPAAAMKEDDDEAVVVAPSPPPSSPVLATAEDEMTAAATTMKTASSSSADPDSKEMAVAANSRDEPQNQQQQTATTEDETMTTTMKTASSSSADPDSTEMAVAANSRDEPQNHQQQQQQTAITEDKMMTTMIKTASSSSADPDSTEMAVAANSRDEPQNQQRPSTAGPHRNKKRPRRAPPQGDLLQAFRRRRHGLRLPASNLAACAGFHPWKNLPELVQLLVYQGSAGRQLLRRDCELMGLQPVADGDQILNDLAQRAGTAAAAAVAEALHVQDGTKVVPTVEAAAAVKRKAIREATASTLINPTERKLFAEGVRRCVNTGYGTSHESAGLDLYERETGWPVRQRNAEIRAWPFRAVVAANGSRNNNNNNSSNDDDERNNRGIPTVAPMGEAAPLSFRNNRNNDDDTNNAPITAGGGGAAAAAEAPPSADEDATTRKRPKVIDLTVGEEETEPPDDNSEEDSIPLNDEGTDDEKPFFSILGSVDGIRDELAPNHGSFSDHDADADDSSWVLRQVVVECKHRMRKIAVPHPPLYEQIQAVAYCFLYNVREADLVQILRREKQQPDKKRQRPRTAPDKKEQQPTVLESWLNDDTNAGTDPVNNTALNAPEASHCVEKKKNRTGVSGPAANVKSEATVGPTIDDAPKEPKVPDDDVASKTDNNNDDLCSHTVTIAISRISLDDEIMQHGRQWHDVILPRLRSFAEAVYSIRRDDDKRYRLLASLAAESGELLLSTTSTTTAADAGWQLLFEECPWLETCDTAFRNQRA